MSRLPITIITGFAGSGKTTLILNLVPQLRAQNPGYKLALIKNEIGDVAVDTALAAAAELTGTAELLGDCICCTNVGQIGSALAELDAANHPDRVIIETSGSAEPLKLVLEVNRLARETGRYELDGVVSVIDAENWGGYANTSFTAKLQAQQTDLIVVNKWESLGERRFDLFVDRLGDLDVDTPWIKSDKGWIAKDLLFGLDSKMVHEWTSHAHEHSHSHSHSHDNDGGHTSEIECISITLIGNDSSTASVDMSKLDQLLKSAPKEEVYRIKSVLYSDVPPQASSGDAVNGSISGRSRYILNWSFGRWTWSHDNFNDADAPALRMSIFTAPYESNKWMKKIETAGMIALKDGQRGRLTIKKVQ